MEGPCADVLAGRDDLCLWHTAYRMQGFTSQVLSTVSNDRHSARSHKAATQLLISTSWVPGSKTCPCLLGITCTSRGRRIKKQCALGKTPPWETRVQEGSFPQLLSSQLQIQNTVFVLKGIFTWGSSWKLRDRKLLFPDTWHRNDKTAKIWNYAVPLKANAFTLRNKIPYKS